MAHPPDLHQTASAGRALASEQRQAKERVCTAPEGHPDQHSTGILLSELPGNRTCKPGPCPKVLRRGLHTHVQRGRQKCKGCTFGADNTLPSPQLCLAALCCGLIQLLRGADQAVCSFALPVLECVSVGRAGSTQESRRALWLAPSSLANFANISRVWGPPEVLRAGRTTISCAYEYRHPS